MARNPLDEFPLVGASADALTPGFFRTRGAGFFTFDFIFSFRPQSYRFTTVWSSPWMMLPCAKLETPQEIDQQLIDLPGALLLDPVAAAGDQMLFVEIRDMAFEVLVPVGHHIDHDIAIARREHGRTDDLRAIEERRQFPIPIDVAVPVDAAAKTGLLELALEKREVLLAQSRR
jgi:hypothetical protein